MSQFDLTILHAIQSWQSPNLTVVMKVASWVFTPEVIIPLLGLVGVVLLIRNRRLQDALFFLLLAGNGLVIVLKPIFHRLRPTANVATIIDHQGSYSMPSGHAVVVTILCASVILLAGQRLRRHRWWLTVLMVIAILLVGVSRVYLGAHWPSDVIMGYVIGLLWVACIWYIVKPLLEHWWVRRNEQQSSSS